jgi:hypothetical protein
MFSEALLFRRRTIETVYVPAGAESSGQDQDAPEMTIGWIRILYAALRDGPSVVCFRLSLLSPYLCGWSLNLWCLYVLSVEHVSFVRPL